MSGLTIESFTRPEDKRIREAEKLFNEHDYEQAFDVYNQCAVKGNPLSKCRMGVMYYEGLGVDKRPIKAFNLIKESYNTDYLETVFQLGKCYFEGIGTDENKELGFEMIVCAAEGEHPPAENYIAALYLNGEYVEKNKDKGMSWLMKAVDHEDPKALYNLGVLHQTNKIQNSSHYRAIDLWKKSAGLHYPPAMRELGDEYLKRGDEENIKKGLKYLEKATEYGDGKAAKHLGDFYLSMIDDGKRPDEAIRYYDVALANGNKDALYDLGRIYRDLSEYKKAYEYFKEGYDNDDPKCSYEYAMLKYKGLGTEEDNELAFKILLKGAENGNTLCMGMVGHCYYFGIGVNPDKYYSKEWFERGCEKDDGYCTFRLAEFYLRNITHDCDRRYGLELLRRSFDQGVNSAAYKLGNIYENDPEIDPSLDAFLQRMNEDGEIIRSDFNLKSIPDAIYWYMAGADKKNVKCMMKLAGHYESGEFIQKSEKKAFDLYQDAYKIDNEPIAAAEIGRCFEEGIGTDVDIKTAVSWYLKAARRNAFAMWRLYNIYIERNETDRAVFWLRRSASKGSVSAMVELAKIYEEGKLVPKSDFKAMCWYHKASDEGNEHAKSRFEELIRFDPQDPEDIGDYERATRILGEEDDDKHIIDLAEDLTEGNDFPMDLPKAKIWYEIASQLGVHGAKDGLKKIESMLKGEKQISDKQTTLKVME